MRLSWRRQAHERGLAGVTQGWRGFVLWRGDEDLIRVAGTGNSRHSPTAFYWCGCGRNTLGEGTTFTTVEAAKKDAMIVAKAWLAMRESKQCCN